MTGRFIFDLFHVLKSAGNVFPGPGIVETNSWVGECVEETRMLALALLEEGSFSQPLMLCELR